MSDIPESQADLESDSEHNPWREMDTYTCKKFIEDVRDDDFAGLFNGSAYELWVRNLRFFDGYEHYILNNKMMFPFFSLHYISNGEDHYFLDGSEHCLEMLVKKGAFRLNEHNIFEYLQFHSDATFYPYRKVKFITDPIKTPYSGASAMGHHFKTLKYHAKAELKESAEDGCFYVVLPVLYNGETVEGRVQVRKTGEINILAPVNIPLMEGNKDHKPLDYDHPYEQDLLRQNIDILKNSAEGDRLYETIKSYNGQIKFVSGVGSNGLAINGSMGFVVAPENIDAPSPYQVIAIAGVLRQMEHYLLNMPRPDPFSDAEEMIAMNLALNLDVLETICIIVEELNDQGFEDILKKFKESGFEEFYSGFKNEFSNEKMTAILAKRFDIETRE